MVGVTELELNAKAPGSHVFFSKVPSTPVCYSHRSCLGLGLTFEPSGNAAAIIVD